MLLITAISLKNSNITECSWIRNRISGDTCDGRGINILKKKPPSSMRRFIRRNKSINIRRGHENEGWAVRVFH